MSDTFMKQDMIECSDDENYGFKYNQVGYFSTNIIM